MSILSIFRRLQLSKAGASRSDAKIAAARRNIVPQRQYNLTTFAGMRDSLEKQDQERLDKWAKSTRSLAQPFNSVRRLPDGSIVPFCGDYTLLTNEEKENVMLSNVNVCGQGIGLQRIVANQKLQRLGLPEEVIPTAFKFAEQTISRVMGGKENA